MQKARVLTFCWASDIQWRLDVWGHDSITERRH